MTALTEAIEAWRALSDEARRKAVEPLREYAERGNPIMTYKYRLLVELALAAAEPEAKCGTCGGTRELYFGKHEPKPCPDCAAEPEAKACSCGSRAPLGWDHKMQCPLWEPMP